VTRIEGRFGTQGVRDQIGVLAQAVARALDGHGRNAKLVFSSFLKVDASNISLYRHPKHRRSCRRPQNVSII
jgi:hypothetical protein